MSGLSLSPGFGILPNESLKLRRAEERFIPQSTRAGSFKRLLGGTVTATSLQIDRSPQAGAQLARGVEPEIAASVARSMLPFRSSTRVWALEGRDPSTHTPG